MSTASTKTSVAQFDRSWVQGLPKWCCSYIAANIAAGCIFSCMYCSSMKSLMHLAKRKKWRHTHVWKATVVRVLLRPFVPPHAVEMLFSTYPFVAFRNFDKQGHLVFPFLRLESRSYRGRSRHFPAALVALERLSPSQYRASMPSVARFLCLDRYNQRSGLREALIPFTWDSWMSLEITAPQFCIQQLIAGARKSSGRWWPLLGST